MIRITQLKLPINHTPEDLREKISRTLRCGKLPFQYKITRQSLDARHKNDKKFVYTVDVTFEDEKKISRRVYNNNIMSISEKPYHFPEPGTEPLHHRPVIIGSGPAGIFCAWYLAKAGYRPIVLERGRKLPEEKKP